MKLVLLLMIAPLAFVAQLLPASGEAATPLSGPSIQFDTCNVRDPDRTSPYIVWGTANAGQQWLDISLVDNGFAPGTFITAGPFESDRSAYIWDGMLADRTHFARVNTLTASGWRPTATTSFTTADCRAPRPAAPRDVSQECEGETITAAFSWDASYPMGRTEWLDLSTQNNGFGPGTFLSAGPLGTDTPRFVWRGLRGSTKHYWRVNTWDGTRWITSATGEFISSFVLRQADGSCSVVHGDPGP